VDGDDARTLLHRAETALETARASGGNSLWRHDGEQVESVLEPAVATAQSERL
jgi:hypothetical protein